MFVTKNELLDIKVAIHFGSVSSRDSVTACDCEGRNAVERNLSFRAIEAPAVV